MSTNSEAILEVGGESLTRSELAAALAGAKKQIAQLRAPLSDDEFMPMLVDNSMSSHIALLAAAEMGANVAVIDSTVTNEQLARILQNFESSVVMVANPDMRGRVYPQHREFIPLQRDSDEYDHDHTETSRDGSIVVFSSGSTSDPKGVIHRWETLIGWSAIRYADARDSTTGEIRALNMSPISWGSGLMQLLVVLLGGRLRTLDMQQYAPSQLLVEIERFQPGLLVLTSNLAQAMGNVAKEWSSSPVKSIDEVFIGAGKVRWETVNLFSRFVPETAIFSHNLSATEALRMFVVSVPFAELPRSGPVPLGRPRIPENIRLEPTDDEDVYEVFAAGDIAVGYLNAHKSIEAFPLDSNGRRWWKSGELVRIDRQTGEYFHVGRLDNMIKVNDHNVSLDDIETLLLGFSAVEMAAVVAAEVNGRIRIVAFVVLSDDTQHSRDDVGVLLRESLPRYALPHDVIALSEFPTTRTGKIDRGSLIKLVSGGTA